VPVCRIAQQFGYGLTDTQASYHTPLCFSAWGAHSLMDCLHRKGANSINVCAFPQAGKTGVGRGLHPRCSSPLLLTAINAAGSIILQASAAQCYGGAFASRGVSLVFTVCSATASHTVKTKRFIFVRPVLCFSTCAQFRKS